MADDIRVREAVESDRDGILELMRSSLGEGAIPRSLDFWRWKHEENPFGPSPCLVATAGEEIVGLRVFMRWSWTLGSTRLKAVRAVDTATHPEWRGRGIFSRLTRGLVDQMTREGVSFVFNTPNPQSRAGYLKMGWRDVGRVTPWVRPMRPTRLLSSVFSARLRSSDDDAFEDPPEPPGTDPGELFGRSDVEAFLRAVAPPADRLATTRTATYMRWRYGNVPGTPYRASGEVQGSSGAILVFRLKVRRGKTRELRFCELLVGDDSESRKVAARLAKRVLGATDADFAAIMVVTGGRSAPLLPRLGFAPAPRLGPIMTVRPLAGEGLSPEELVQRSSWHTSIGDLELF